MKNKGYLKIRIKDIAGIAGVSAGTVDRVLHNRGEVSAKTRSRILDIIRDMDYHPDILASTLAARKPLNFAAVIPREKEGSPFWRYPLAGIEEGLLEIMHFGISLDKYFFDYSDRYSFLEASARMVSDSPGGVILAPVFSDDASQVIEKCNGAGIPVVLINAGICTGSYLAFVGQDSIQSGMVAGKLMHYGIGERSGIMIVNFIREHGSQEHIQRREEGFRSYFSSLTGHNDINIRRLDLPDAGGTQPFVELDEALSKEGFPAGIFVTNSRVFRVARFLQEINRNDIVLIGYDLLEENKEFLRSGTIDFLISQKPREQGYLSMITLYQHLVFKKEVEKDQYLPVDIITKENLEHYKYT